MRKRAFCNNCKKMRKIMVEVQGIGTYDPSEEFGDMGVTKATIVCNTCYADGSQLQLSFKERDELYKAAMDYY